MVKSLGHKIFRIIVVYRVVQALKQHVAKHSSQDLAYQPFNSLNGMDTSPREITDMAIVAFHLIEGTLKRKGSIFPINRSSPF